MTQWWTKPYNPMRQTATKSYIPPGCMKQYWNKSYDPSGRQFCVSLSRVVHPTVKICNFNGMFSTFNMLNILSKWHIVKQ